MDPELKSHLQLLEERLLQIKNKTDSLPRAFFKGILTGAGSVIGAILILVIAGWVLNNIGVIPAFREQAQSWQKTLDDLKRIR
jgi:hypothetical protein